MKKNKRRVSGKGPVQEVMGSSAQTELEYYFSSPGRERDNS